MPKKFAPQSGAKFQYLANPKARVVLEFFVIVFSILVAFGLDAWWSSRNESSVHPKTGKLL